MRPPPGYRGGRGGRGSFDNYGRPMRGRGGYGPPARGGYGPRGGRGGYGPQPRGGYGPSGMRGGRSPPPGGYAAMPGSFDDRRPSPAEPYGPYDQGPSDPSVGYMAQARTSGGFEPYNPDTSSLPRAESPPPMTGHGHSVSPHEQAVEMDATPADPPQGYGQYGQLRNSDTDVAGMVGLQQGHEPGRHETYVSEDSKYSQDE